MNTTTKYSVSDAAILYKKSRATIYKDIKNGILSRDHDGVIDFSELLRAYGEPFGRIHKKRIDTYPIQNKNTPEYTDNTVSELKNQIAFLKAQLEKAEDRESKANARIDTLLTLIEMKPSKSDMTTFTDQEKISSNDVPVVEKITNEPKNVLIEKESTSKKRGILSRIFR